MKTRKFQPLHRKYTKRDKSARMLIDYVSQTSVSFQQLIYEGGILISKGIANFVDMHINYLLSSLLTKMRTRTVRA